LNVDDEHLIFMQPDDIESFIEAVTPMIKTGCIAGLILDSEAAAPTRAMMVDEFGKANFGAGAKAMAESLRRLNILCANYETTYFIISQERANMQPMSHLPSVTGGMALPFYASVRNRVTKIETIERDGDTVGINMRVRNYKNKTGVPFRTAELKFYYKGGFDPNDEYFDFFLKFGLIIQKGAFFSIPTIITEGTKDKPITIQGRAKAQAWLNEHPEVLEKWKLQVNDLLCKKTAELDANNKDPTPEEEAEVGLDREFVENALAAMGDDEEAVAEIEESGIG
jgi:recombination protein RecA